MTLLSLVILPVLVPFLSADTSPSTETPPLVISGQSSNGAQVELQFATATVTTQTHAAVVCTNPATPITDVVLWMPDMGHGSSPTQLAPQPTQGCMAVNKMAFFMKGAWDVRVLFSDQSLATLHVNVE